MTVKVKKQSMKSYLYTTNIKTLAVTYSCNAYGAGTYNNNDECVTGTGTATTPEQTLSSTGYDILVPAGVGVAFIALAVAILIKRRRTKTSAPKSHL